MQQNHDALAQNAANFCTLSPLSFPIHASASHSHRLAIVYSDLRRNRGETSCAFDEIRPGCQTDDDKIVSFCRANQVGFKTPKAVIITELPKTLTEKNQKFPLRETVKAAKE